ncbi:hypothetical protein Zm00014a_032189, partial [Zea mays]
LENILLRSGTE